MQFTPTHTPKRTKSSTQTHQENMSSKKIRTPADILKLFPVRKNKKQKEKFRNAIQSYAEGLGYDVTIEPGKLGSRNVVIGNPETAKYLITAHYDTPAGIWVPNFMVPCNFLMFIISQIFVTSMLLLPALVPALVVWLIAKKLTTSQELHELSLLVSMYLIAMVTIFGPANRNNANDNTSGIMTVMEMAASMSQDIRDQVCFVLFDMEELGMIGSSSYHKSHSRAVKNQIVLNLDCVGDGDTIMLLPNKNIKKDSHLMERLCGMEGTCDNKTVMVHKKGFSFFPSDQVHFRKGVGICALRKGRLCYYAGRIHTFRDTILDYANVNILSSRLVDFIRGEGSES